MSYRSRIAVLAIVALTASAPGKSHMPPTGDDPIVAGYIEKIHFSNGSVPFSAKLDSGANSGSINAQNPEVFHREGRYWIRFRLKNRQDQTQTIEVPIKSTVRIRRANTKTTRRFLIDLQTCIGGYRSTSEFSLADRRGLSYQVLVGRKLLADRVLIDTSSRNILGNDCIRN